LADPVLRTERPTMWDLMNANRGVEITLDTVAESVGPHLDATPLAIVGPIFGD
jgi:hypothetical protein